MPQQSLVIDINYDIVKIITVRGRVEVDAPFFGGSSGTARDVKAEALAKSLADRIERAARSAIVDFCHVYELELPRTLSSAKG